MENRVSEIEAKIRAKRDAEKAAKKRIELELKNEVAERLKPYTIPTHEAIWSAIERDDDWTPFEDKVNAIRHMGDAMASDA